jgi:hypothetical protein
VHRARFVRQAREDRIDRRRVLMRIVPPQAVQVSTSMPNTRFRRCAQRIAAWRSLRIRTSAFADSALPSARPALVTNARCARLGTNTTWVVPLLYGVLSW